MTHTSSVSQSMTGFASIRQAFAEGEFAPNCPPLWVEVECQSINSKYLEVFWRADETLRRFEMPIRKAIKTAFARGRISINLSIRVDSTVDLDNYAKPSLDSRAPNQPAAIQALTQMEKWQEALLQRFPNARPLSVFESLQLMQWDAPLLAIGKPNQGFSLSAIESRLEQSSDEREAWLAETCKQLMPVVDTVINKLRISREQEASRILPMMTEKTEALMADWALIGALVKNVTKSIANRLKEQLTPILQDHLLEPSRLTQEVALLVIRHDVTEELDRLQSHGENLRDLLSGAHLTLGKPLEFLLQELGREVNTIASKTTQTEVTNHTINMKHLIDQIREQAQNLQ